MKNNRSNNNATYQQFGFTLVELLIVVVILGILAAVVIPQFSDSSDSAREAALKSNLGTLRSAIELYKADHGDYPGLNASSGGTCTGGTAGTGAAGSEQALIDQLTRYTDPTGASCDLSIGSFVYGPYIKKGIPDNPYTASSDFAMDTTTALGGLSASGTEAWRYADDTGELIANDSAAHAAF